MKILVVDDQPLIVEDILDELHGIVPEALCVGASDPEEALRLFELHQFDVVFLDIDMPGMNGFSLAERIQRTAPKVNIVYVTGHEKYALESFNTYASDFLVKPVNARRLKKAMDNLRFPVSEITEELIASHSSGGAVIGGRIRRYRERRRLSRSALAEQMNVSVQSVYRWESGERTPDVVTLLELARILGVSPDQMMGLRE